MRRLFFILPILALTAFLYMRTAEKDKQIAACPLSNQLVVKLDGRGEVAALKKEAVRALPALSFLGEKQQAFFKDRLTLLNLWATWCAPCKAEMPALDRLQAAKGSDKFHVAAINIDTRALERVEKFLLDTGLKHMVNYQDVEAKIFQELKTANLAFGMPTTLLIGGDGCVFASLAGPAEWSSADAFNVIDGLLK